MTFCQSVLTFVKKKNMAKIYVKGYTKSDGTKVDGYWRELKKGEVVRDQYRQNVEVFEVIGNMARTDKGMYHLTKLFSGGKSLMPTIKRRSYGPVRKRARL